jgi:signal transduction histidine kinase/DNA-binding response OmpR family regulator
MTVAATTAETAVDPADPGVERELTSRLVRRNMGVRSLLLLIWPIYAVLDAWRTPWWLFVALAGLHIVGRLGYPRLERVYGVHADDRPAGHWQNLHLALTLWNGMIVGVGAAVVALSADPPVLFSLCLLLIILALGSPSRAYSARSYAGYVIALLLPMSIALVVTGDRLAMVLGIACLPPFGLGLLLVARGQQRFAREMIAVTLSRERLLGRLEAARGEGEEARSTLRTALNALSEAVFLYAPDGRLLLLNEAAFQIHAIDRAAPLVGRTFREILEAQADRGDFGQLDASTREAAIAGRMEQFNRGTNGWLQVRRRDRWLELSTSVLPDGHRLIVHRDVTDLKNSETAASDAREMLQTALDALSDAVILYGPDKRLQFINRVARQTLGDLPIEQLIGGTVRELVGRQIDAGVFGPLTPGECEAAIALREGLLENGTDGWYPLRRRDRWMEVSVVILADGRRVVVHRDVTDLKNSEAAATEARETLQTALNALSDDVVLYGPDGRVAYINDAARHSLRVGFDEQMTGRTLRQLLERQMELGEFGSLDAAKREAVIAEFEKQFATGTDGWRLARRRDRWVEVSMVVLSDGRRLVVRRDVTDLKNSEKAATEARAKLIAAMETMAGGIAFLDADERLELCNEAFKRFMNDDPLMCSPGVTLEEACRQGATRLPAEIRERSVVEGLRRYRAGESVLIPFGDGRWARMEMRRTADGRWTLLATDVTGERQRQRELEAALTAANEAQAKLIAAMETMAGGIAFLDAQERLELCNDAFKRFMNNDPLMCSPGITLEGGIRQGARRLPPERREEAIESALRRYRAGEPIVVQFGDNRYARMVMRYTNDGRSTLLVTDVTEQRQRQHDLQQALDTATEARSKLVSAIESMADGIAFFDADDRLELCNEAYKRFMTNNPGLYEKGVSLSYTVVMAAEAGAAPEGQAADWIASSLLSLRTGDPIHFRFGGSGSRQWARALARSAEGRTTLLVTDVTEQRRRQSELEEALESAEAARAESDAANQAKSTFLATMSHEIRTPMNGVLGMIEVLGRETLNDDQRDLVHTMRDSAGSVLRLLDDLLDFSKIEAGRIDLEAAAFSLSSVVERAADNFRAAAAAKGVSLSVAMAPGSADALIGDPTRMRQIVANLIGNAVKFTQRGAVIVRALTRPLGEGRTEIEIAVSDTGIGMDATQLAGLFKPFAQADSGTTRRYGGTGLGLSIVRRLAQLMDGDVTVRSAPSAGSTFTVTLILQAAPADSPLVELQTQAGGVGTDVPIVSTVPSHARVLVVDDHPVNLKVALRQLASFGVAADTAANGREGLERWRAGDYALVLADVHMPDMDGFEMTALIRAEEARRNLPRTPIVASTANAMKGEDERCRAAGMDGYLAKPVETERLRAVIERWLPGPDQPAARADATTDAAVDVTAILDRSVLQRWSGGDTAFERDLIATFTGELEQSERDIDAALRAGDLARVAQAAHRLKGSALQIGAKRTGAVALALEEAGKAADRQRCQDERGRLAAELRRLTSVLQSAGGTNM